MTYDYFKKINNTYNSESRQETDLYLLNRHVNRYFDKNIDYHKVLKNGEPFELLIIKDTDSNTYKKKIKSRPYCKFNLGDYIEWDSQMWIVALVDSDDKTYNSGYMYLCSLLLVWQNTKGEIVKRWAYAEDYTKYSTGVSGNYNIKTGDYQYGLTLPVDEETKYLKRDRRFAIDLEGLSPPDVYVLTNRKIFLSDNRYFGRGGLINITLSYDSFNAVTDRFISINEGESFWICDYFDPNNNTQPTPPRLDSITAEIADTSAFIFIGRAKTLKAIFKDESGNILSDITPEWEIISSFQEDIKAEYLDNVLLLTINNEKYIGEKITVNLRYDGLPCDSFTMEVTDI